MRHFEVMTVVMNIADPFDAALHLVSACFQDAKINQLQPCPKSQ